MVKALSTPDRTSTILDAAVELLRTRGPAGLTVRDVAKAAGCSTTGVYTWFGSKNGLLDAIVVGGFESFDAALASVAVRPDGAPDIDWVVARGIEYRRWARAHATEYLVMFTRAVPEHLPGEAAQRRGLESFAAHVESIRRVQAAGQLGVASAHFVAHHIWATVHGYVMLELSGPGSESADPDHYETGLRATLLGLTLEPGGRAGLTQTEIEPLETRSSP